MLAVRELRYQPNADARELSGKRSRIIGLIYENAEEFSYLNDVFNGALGICEPAGYRRALKQHGVAYAPRLVRQGYFDFESGRIAAGRMLDLPEPPSAVLASNDDMAAGAIFAARNRGLRHRGGFNGRRHARDDPSC